VWDRLLTGVVLDALEAGPGKEQVGEAEVQRVLASLRDAPWQQAPAVGAGEEFRAEMDGDRHASALTCGGAVVHESLVAAG
jgi:hypothetical protein